MHTSALRKKKVQFPLEELRNRLFSMVLERVLLNEINRLPERIEQHRENGSQERLKRGAIAE